MVRVIVLVKQHSHVPLIHLNVEPSKSETIRTSAKVEQTLFREEMFAKVPRMSQKYIHVLSLSFTSAPLFFSFRAHFSSTEINYQAKRKRECEMADLVLQCRGPVGLGQEQEFPVQTLSLLEETGEPAPQKSTLFTATKENLHNRHTQPWKYEYFKSVFFPRIHSALISLGGQ